MMPTPSPCHDSCWRYCLACIGSAAMRRLFDLESEGVWIEVGMEAGDLAVGHLQDAHALIQAGRTRGARPRRCPLKRRPAITDNDVAEARADLTEGVPVCLPKRACSFQSGELSWGNDVADLTFWPEQSGNPLRVAL